LAKGGTRCRYDAGSSQSPSSPASSPIWLSLVVGWERFFIITSETVQRGAGARVAGYVGNEAGFKATRVRILIDGLDASGQIVDQTIWWIGSPGPGPGGRVYYDAPAPAGTSHRVSVFSYDWVQSAELDAP
jgi:hypothetical protein